MPAYNEAAQIGNTLLFLRDYLVDHRGGNGWEIIVVDDGSYDDTSAAAAQIAHADGRFRHIRHETNKGKGCAVRTGILAAHGQFVGFMDADLSTDLSAIAGALSLLHEGEQIVIASRRVPGARILLPQPLYRRLASSSFRVLTRAITGLKGIRDSQCGFKFCAGEAARTLFSDVTTDGFLFDVELLALAQRRGYRIVEMPVTWTNRRQSKLRVWPLAFYVLRDLVRIRRRLSKLGRAS